MVAVRGGLGDILAGGVAAGALGVLVFPLGFSLLLAIPLAVGIYAGLLLLLPARIERPRRALGEAVRGPDVPPEMADAPPAGASEASESAMALPAHIAAARRLGLTRREHEIVILLAQSHPMLTNQELATELSIAFRTVDNHVARSLDKLELTSRRELPAFARKHGLLPPPPPALPPE